MKNISIPIILIALWLTQVVPSMHAENVTPLNFGAVELDAKYVQTLTQATADFQAVTNGKPPIFAKLDVSKPLPADGGTVYYKATHYALVVRRSVVRLAGKDGYLYGPIIYFDADITDNSNNFIGNIKYYTKEEMAVLLKK